MTYVAAGDKLQIRAADWNTLQEVAAWWRRSAFSRAGGNATRDVRVKVKNSSGANRKRGEVLELTGFQLGAIEPSHLWFTGAGAGDDILTGSAPFGILADDTTNGDIGEVHISGVCFALIDIGSTAHEWAYVADTDYTLQSADSGPVRILHQPGSTGTEKECVVMLGCIFPGVAVARTPAGGIAAATVASGNLTPGSASCDLYAWSWANSRYEDTGRNITVHNLATSGAIGGTTFIQVKQEQTAGKWVADFEDCT